MVQFATPPGPPQSKAPDERIVKYLISFNFGILACDLRFMTYDLWVFPDDLDVATAVVVPRGSW